MVFDTLNLRTPVPAIQGRFGDRIATYTTQVSPAQIANLLGHDPRSKNWKRLPSDELREIYEYLQRKTEKSRRESVAGYIEERFGQDALTLGAFPAISIAFRDETEFVPYARSQPGAANVPNAIGELQVDIAPSSIRVLIDGLGRVTGALDLLEEGKGDLLANFLFAVTIYVPRPGTKPFSWQEMGQLFHDFNFRVQPVSGTHAIRLDTSDIYISLARRLAESPFIADNGGVSQAASLGGKSTELVVLTTLVRTVRGATEGRKFQESNLATADENPNLTRETFNAVLASIDGFFSGIASLMGKDRFTDRQNLHLTSPGWQALGIIHHDLHFKLKLTGAERQQVLDRIAAIDWSRGNPDWLALGIGHPEIDKKTGSQVLDDLGRPRVALTGAGRTNTQKLIDYIRAKAGIAEKVAASGLAADEAPDLAA